LKTKIGNQNLSYEISAKPAGLNTVDQVLSAKHAGKYEPDTGVYETTNGFKYGSPSVGPVRFWTTVSFYSSYYPVYLNIFNMSNL
jgi:hypothetical protein